MTDEIGTVTMYPKLERREWIFGTAPDPRDARIAELEARVAGIKAALPAWKAKDIATTLARNCYFGYGAALLDYADALVPSPESDMTITVEDLPA